MNVRRFRNIWFVLAAFLWLPALAHCQLESLTGFELLQCHEETSAAHSSSQDCTDCCAVENSAFHAGLSRLSVTPPDLLPIFLTFLLPTEPVQLTPVTPLVLTSAPPDLPTRWHFLSRTALPVRAPSLVS